MKKETTGVVQQAYGNLIEVEFEGAVRLGEMALLSVGEQQVTAETLEVNGQRAKIQVYDAIDGVCVGATVTFIQQLLEVELGPGLLASIYDGLQRPLHTISEEAGLYLERGVHVPSINREKKWEFHPTAPVGSVVGAGDPLGFVFEGALKHWITVPFQLQGRYTIDRLAHQGNYTVTDEVAYIIGRDGAAHTVTMLQRWPVKQPLQLGKKILPQEAIETGLRVIDTQFPLLRGGTFCTPGPFGAGKTVLQQHLARFSTVDVVIVAACGERAGEVVETLKEFPHLVDPQTQRPLIERTIILCNTSSMPVAAREASVYMGCCLGEYYRHMGLNVLVLADSTSRWAQALREMSSRLEEIPGDEAFPAYLASRIAAFYQRSGCIVSPVDGQKIGSLTIGGSVSPAGGNFEEPVTQATLAVVGAFLGLSRARSDARKYPAIDPLISWSKYRSAAGKQFNKYYDNWASCVEQAQKLLVQGQEIAKRMEVVGQEGISLDDFIVKEKAELYDFVLLQQNAFDKEDAYCTPARQGDLLSLIDRALQTKFSFQSYDAAKGFFLQLRNILKNLNFTTFQSEEYKKLKKKGEKMLSLSPHEDV